MSVVIPSSTFKQFTCACVSTFNETTFDIFVGKENNSNTKYENTSKHLSSFANIGVYDPVLFEAGRKLAKDGFITQNNSRSRPSKCRNGYQYGIYPS